MKTECMEKSTLAIGMYIKYIGMANFKALCCGTFHQAQTMKL